MKDKKEAQSAMREYHKKHGGTWDIQRKKDGAVHFVNYKGSKIVKRQIVKEGINEAWEPDHEFFRLVAKKSGTKPQDWELVRSDYNSSGIYGGVRFFYDMRNKKTGQYAQVQDQAGKKPYVFVAKESVNKKLSF